MKNNTKKDEVQFRCSCAIGDLSEKAELKPVKKTEPKIKKKILKKDDLNHKK